MTTTTPSPSEDDLRNNGFYRDAKLSPLFARQGEGGSANIPTILDGENGELPGVSTPLPVVACEVIEKKPPATLTRKAAEADGSTAETPQISKNIQSPATFAHDVERAAAAAAEAAASVPVSAAGGKPGGGTPRHPSSPAAKVPAGFLPPLVAAPAFSEPHADEKSDEAHAGDGVGGGGAGLRAPSSAASANHIGSPLAPLPPHLAPLPPVLPTNSPAGKSPRFTILDAEDDAGREDEEDDGATGERRTPRPESLTSAPTPATTTPMLRGGSDAHLSGVGEKSGAVNNKFRSAASTVKTTESVVASLRVGLASKSQHFRTMRDEVCHADRRQDVVTSRKASVIRLNEMLEGAAIRSALQLALCVCIGVYNYSDPAVSEVLPFASFQVITYIFLSESTAGSIAVKSWNRVLGTLGGAALGWFVVKIMEAVPGAILQRVVCGILVALTLGVGQYCKTKYSRPYAFTMFNLTFWLVIALNYTVEGSVNDIETGIRIPLWRFVQVCIGCFIIIVVSNNFFPTYERLQLRRKAGGLVTKLAAAVTKLVNVLVDDEKEAPSFSELSELVTQTAALKGSIQNAKHEVYIFASPSIRFFRSSTWGKMIPAMMELAACVQSLGVVISDQHFNRELTDESSDVRDGVELLGDQLSQCLLKVNEMIVAGQTANTHAIGALHNAYGRWKSNSLPRRVGPDAGNASDRSTAAAAAAADPAEAYLQILASFMDEVDLAEVLTGSLEFKIRRWHTEYSAAHEASDARGTRRSASIKVLKGRNGEKGSCVLPGDEAGEVEAVEATRVTKERSKSAETWKRTARKVTKNLHLKGLPSAEGEGGEGGESGSSDLDNLLNTMLHEGLLRGGAMGSFGGSQHEAERKVRYLNSFLTTAGIMLGCLRRMTTLLAKLGPGGMTGDALLSMRGVAVGSA